MENTYGAWMSDASQLDEGRYWLAEHFSGDLHGTCEFSSNFHELFTWIQHGNFLSPGRVLFEDMNLSSLQDSKKIIDVKRFYQGCGHVVYKGSFYFHNGGRNKLVK